MKGIESKRVYLTNISICFFLIGLLSASYISLLAGRTFALYHHCQRVQAADGEKISSFIAEKVKPHRLPSGHHIFIDIAHVNSDFLSSEHELVKAITKVVHESQQSIMLSYHCHALYPVGEKTCIAILLDGQITLHTFPSKGVIIMDMFTQNQNIDLITMLPLFEQSFAIPTSEMKDRPKLHWGHKLRGFRTGYLNYKQDKEPYDQELGVDILRRRDFDSKKSIVSTKTKYQSVDIYELLHQRQGTGYLGMRTGKYQDESLDSHVLEPDRALFIDGVLQSSLYGGKCICVNVFMTYLFTMTQT